MTSFMRRRRREIVEGIKHLWWIFVIVMPLTGFGLWLAIDHANANQARALKHSNAQFARALTHSNEQAKAANKRIQSKFHQAIQISDAKHRQALHAQAVLFAYSINKSTCVLRTIATQQIDRLEATKIGNYKAAEQFWVQIIDNQVPIPAGFDCKSLPKKPPTPVAQPKPGKATP